MITMHLKFLMSLTAIHNIHAGESEMKDSWLFLSKNHGIYLYKARYKICCFKNRKMLILGCRILSWIVWWINLPWLIIITKFHFVFYLPYIYHTWRMHICSSIIQCGCNNQKSIQVTILNLRGPKSLLLIQQDSKHFS